MEVERNHGLEIVASNAATRHLTRWPSKRKNSARKGGGCRFSAWERLRFMGISPPPSGTDSGPFDITPLQQSIFRGGMSYREGVEVPSKNYFDFRRVKNIVGLRLNPL